jgi:hydrogenase maturation factor
MMLGEVSPARLVRPDGARPGDKILLTKGLAIEGTTVLAREHPHIGDLLDPNEIERCSAFLMDPGISVVREALTASRVANIHAMHDPTEGGLATALMEMAEASEVGLRIRRDDIPIYPETKRLCDALQLDPLGLLASGALLIAVASEDSGTVLRALDGKGIPIKEIGEVTRSGDGVYLIQDNEPRPMPVFSRDEVAKALG